MSMSGSLMGYENNNDVHQIKNKKPLKPLPVVSSISSSGVTSETCKPPKSSNRRNFCLRGHVNSLWSVWYGVLAVALQTYIAMRYAKRFTAYLSLPWPADAPPPKMELYVCLALAGSGVILLPVLLGAAFLKLGNFANDGIKLGRHLNACSHDPPSLLSSNPDHSLANSLWKHGGPTAAFIHLCTAMCFLLPSLLMEARLIHAGFLPKEAIWRTDLDWVVIHRDRLVVFSFINPNVNVSTLAGVMSPQPFVTLASREESDEELNVATTTALPLTTPTDKLTDVQNEDKIATKPSMNSRTRTTVVPILKVPLSINESEPKNTMVTSHETPSIVHKTTTIAGVMRTSTMKYGATSKRPATKSVVRSNSSRSRMKTKSLLRISSTAPPISSIFTGNITAESMRLTMNSLADLDHPETLNLELQTAESYGPISLEYFNYAAALAVYSVRYPAVFWSCNKILGSLFSLQLIINSAQSLLAYAGMSVLYKVQVIGPLRALPLLRHRTIATTNNISTIFGDSYFLLNPHVTLVLFALSSLLVLCSSMVMYFYCHDRFTAFVNQERERRVILPKTDRNGNNWVYFTHCTAVCVFLAIAICSAPLLYDYTVIYRGSLDGAILACIVGIVLHLLLWLLLWIFLTVKQRWMFKLTVTIGRASVRSGRSVKLVTDVDLLTARDEDDGTSTPLLVVGNGRTYTIADTSPKKAIMSVIQKAVMEHKAQSQGGNVDPIENESIIDSEEQIYWLRPKLRPSPTQSPNEASGGVGGEKSWLNKKLKPKVTFNDLPSTSGPRNKGKLKRSTIDGAPDDDGDYATLRELPLITSLDPAEDSTSEENKINTGQTPRCLRRADSGVPHEELTPRSDSSTSPPLDVVNSVGSTAGHSNTSSNSETSTSGVHSNMSNVSNVSHVSSHRRATSVDDLTGEPREETREQWRSCSLQRGTQPPTGNATLLQRNSRSAASQSFCTSQYVNHLPLFSNANGIEVPSGCSAVVIGNQSEATVVIRRKLSRTKNAEPLNPNEEPFGRSTNMRMTSFTESNDIRVHASSATLPHYPTQPIVTYPHCSTMPLPHATHNITGGNMDVPSGSCGSVPRHALNQAQVRAAVPAHTTLPSYHNGVRLTSNGSNSNPFVKRFPPVHLHTQPWLLPGHHTFPQAPNSNTKPSVTAQIRQNDRDSANFSMASSGDSDTCLPH